METKLEKDDALFMVSLDGVNFSEDQINRINSGIKDVVMREIAQIDNKGDLIVNKRLDLNPRFKGWEWANRTMGIWIEDFDTYRKRLGL